MFISEYMALANTIGMLVLWAMFWYFVCKLLPMPGPAIAVFQGIVIMISLFASLQAVLGVGSTPHIGPYRPLDSPGPPSIMAPERR